MEGAAAMVEVVDVLIVGAGPVVLSPAIELGSAASLAKSSNATTASATARGPR